MKKALALVMAIAMVASMAAVSFAVTLAPVVDDDTPVNALTHVQGQMATYSSTTKDLTLVASGAEATTFTGKLYVILWAGTELAADAATVANLKVTADWEEGGEFVKSAEIVKKRVDEIVNPAGSNIAVGGNIYLLEIAATGSDLEGAEVIGTITVKGKSGTGTAKDKINGEIDVAFDVAYATGVATANSLSITSDTKTVYNLEALDDDEYEVSFAGDVVVTANVVNEKEVLFAVDTDVIDEIDEAYPEANMDYYAVTASFRKTAEVLVYADEGSYLYEVVDGALVAVDADYDEWEEAFSFRARKLGTYVVSDVELVADEVVATNPSTGAAA